MLRRRPSEVENANEPENEVNWYPPPEYALAVDMPKPDDTLYIDAQPGTAFKMSSRQKGTSQEGGQTSSEDLVVIDMTVVSNIDGSKEFVTSKGESNSQGTLAIQMHSGIFKMIANPDYPDDCLPSYQDYMNELPTVHHM